MLRGTAIPCPPPLPSDRPMLQFVLDLLPAVPPWALGFAVAGLFFAGIVRGFSGFGFALVAVPLLAVVLDPTTAVPCVVVLQVLVGLASLPAARRNADWRILRRLIPAALIGLAPGLALLAVLPADLTRLGIALILLATVAALAAGLQLTAVPGRGATLGVGLLAGVLQGFAAVPGPPVIALFLASPITPTVSRASMMVFFMAVSSTGAVLATFGGLITWPITLLALLLYPAFYLGNIVGARVFHGGGERVYRRVALGLLAVIAVAALARALAGLAGG